MPQRNNASADFYASWHNQYADLLGGATASVPATPASAASAGHPSTQTPPANAFEAQWQQKYADLLSPQPAAPKPAPAPQPPGLLSRIRNAPDTFNAPQEAQNAASGLQGVVTALARGAAGFGGMIASGLGGADQFTSALMQGRGLGGALQAGAKTVEDIQARVNKAVGQPDERTPAGRVEAQTNAVMGLPSQAVDWAANKVGRATGSDLAATTAKVGGDAAVNIAMMFLGGKGTPRVAESMARPGAEALRSAPAVTPRVFTPEEVAATAAAVRKMSPATVKATDAAIKAAPPDAPVPVIAEAIAEVAPTAQATRTAAAAPETAAPPPAAPADFNGYPVPKRQPRSDSLTQTQIHSYKIGGVDGAPEYRIPVTLKFPSRVEAEMWKQGGDLEAQSMSPKGAAAITMARVKGRTELPRTMTAKRTKALEYRNFIREDIQRQVRALEADAGKTPDQMAALGQQALSIRAPTYEQFLKSQRANAKPIARPNNKQAGFIDPSVFVPDLRKTADALRRMGVFPAEGAPTTMDALTKWAAAHHAADVYAQMAHKTSPEAALQHWDREAANYEAVMGEKPPEYMNPHMGEEVSHREVLRAASSLAKSAADATLRNSLVKTGAADINLPGGVRLREDLAPLRVQGTPLSFKPSEAPLVRQYVQALTRPEGGVLSRFNDFARSSILLNPFFHPATVASRFVPQAAAALAASPGKTWRAGMAALEDISNPAAMADAAQHGFQFFHLSAADAAKVSGGRSLRELAAARELGLTAKQVHAHLKAMATNSVNFMGMMQYHMLRDKLIERGEKPEVASAIAGHYAKDIVGTIGRETIGHTTRVAGDVALFSLRYTLSTLRLFNKIFATDREMVSTLRRLGVQPKEAAAMLRKNKARYALALLKDYAAMQAFSQGVSMAFTGKPTWEQPGADSADKWMPSRVPLWMGDDGKRVYINTPFRAVRDLYEWGQAATMHNPSRVIGSKLSPAAHMGMLIADGKDWRGKNLYIPNDRAGTAANYASAALNTMGPIGSLGDALAAGVVGRSDSIFWNEFGKDLQRLAKPEQVAAILTGQRVNYATEQAKEAKPYYDKREQLTLTADKLHWALQQPRDSAAYKDAVARIQSVAGTQQAATANALINSVQLAPSRQELAAMRGRRIQQEESAP